jgi:hypothetical protein
VILLELDCAEVNCPCPNPPTVVLLSTLLPPKILSAFLCLLQQCSFPHHHQIEEEGEKRRNPMSLSLDGVDPRRDGAEPQA